MLNSMFLPHSKLEKEPHLSRKPRGERVGEIDMEKDRSTKGLDWRCSQGGTQHLILIYKTINLTSAPLYLYCLMVLVIGPRIPF